MAQDLAIGVLDRTLTAEDKKAIDATLNFLKSRLTDYKVDIHVFKPSELEEKLKENRIDYFIGTPGFYRRFQKLGTERCSDAFYRILAQSEICNKCGKFFGFRELL